MTHHCDCEDATSAYPGSCTCRPIFEELARAICCPQGHRQSARWGMSKYRTRLRPIGPGTIPRGLNWHWIETPGNGSVDRTDIPRSTWRYGVFGCDRELTPQELADFEIEVVT